MEPNRSRMLTTARPYLQVLSIFGLTPPPVFFTRTLHRRRRGYLILGYGCFLFQMLLMVIYECYANIVVLHQEVNLFQAEDFSKVLGRTQKLLVVVMATCNQLNILLNVRRLGCIYKDIANLELDIDKASIGLSGRRHWWSLRLRLSCAVGLWMVMIIGLMPRFTIGRISSFHWANQVMTEIVLIMLQLKGPEYCLFVILIYELIRRARHILEQIKVDLEDCNCGEKIQELCAALKRNQLLVGQIWRLVGEIGIYFTLSMTLLFLYNGLTILNIVNWSITKYFSPDDYYQYRRLGSSLLLSFNLLLACFYSECCIRAYRSITIILHQIAALPTAEEFPMLKMGLREYSLQMQHLQLNFTCAGFFDINLKNFGGMVVTLCGYIIILIQFKIPGFAQQKFRQNISEISD
ncbi:putative gustatory receptor 98c [Drosophila eugracilis]|uniref:putative gustatory receptor 98c n=1 Tax=Drosophila eugracilis TaxID=29029 RepID=UPI001BDB19F5|nr:putative gustatory receptor 98c [Drosophila eugracilis]